jgi:ABC-type sugar transport system substrate-binding protein
MKGRDTMEEKRALWRRRYFLAAVGLLLAGQVAIGAGVARAGLVKAVSPPLKATKRLCQGKTFKIGYDVFSATQPFANLVTKGMKDAANRIGCATVITTVDNTNGPVAVGNVKTMLNEGANGIIDFNILAPFQPAIARLIRNAHVPGVAVVGADLPGYPSVGADNYGAAVRDGRALALGGRRKFGTVVPYLVIGAEPTAGAIIMQRFFGRRRPHHSSKRRGHARHVQGSVVQEADFLGQFFRW